MSKARKRAIDTPLIVKSIFVALLLLSGVAALAAAYVAVHVWLGLPGPPPDAPKIDYIDRF